MKIAVIFLCFYVSVLSALATNAHFQNISIEHGLSNLNINTLCQDNQGYIWIGTQRGLNRFNGYEFQQYYFDRNDSLGLSSDLITALYCDSDDCLFVGTNNGLSCYNIREQKFIRRFTEIGARYILDIKKWNGELYVATDSGLYKVLQSGEVTLISERIRINVLFVDRKKRLWCGSNRELLFVENNSVVHAFSGNEAFLHGPNIINSIYEDYQRNQIWLGTNNGITLFGTATMNAAKNLNGTTPDVMLSGCKIEFIIEKTAGIIWIGTYNSGLYEYNVSTGKLGLLNSDNVISGLNSKSFSSVLVDNCGNTWLGTFDNGLAVNFKYFKNFNPDANLNRLTKNKFITSISSFGNSSLLISTRGDGFYTYNKTTGNSCHYTSGNSDLGSNFLKNTCLDNSNQVWIGSLSGIQVFNLSTQTFYNLSPEIKIGYSTIFCDKEWIYLGIPGLGLMVFDKDRSLIYHIEKCGPNITKIVEVNENELLLTSFGRGVYLYDKNTKNAIPLHEKFPEVEGLNRIVTAHIDKTGDFWLGSYLWGMYCVDRKNGTISNFDKSTGLPSNDVIGIVEDEYNQLWLSTSYGLSRLNKNTGTIKNYFINEGVNNTQFHEKSAFRSDDGMIFIGGNYGLTCFYPEQLVLPNVAPLRLILEELQVLNNTVMPSSDGRILKEPISFASKITLSHKEKEFSLKLTAFDFLSSEQVQYAYRLKGLDKNWIEIGTRRLVSFAYLKPGTYTFQFKAKSTDGDWSEPSKPLEIEIRPAPWFAWWALSLYALIIALTTWGVFRFLFRLKLYRHKLEMEQYEHQREKDIHEMKLRFFTNISHEFRTPLTIISGLAKQLTDSNKSEQQKSQVIQSLQLNIKRLLKLVNQILVFRELEKDTLELKLKTQNIAVLVADAVKPFEFYAAKKDIAIHYSNVDNYNLALDDDKVDKVLSNIIANAVKFTPNGGNIKISSQILNANQVKSAYETATLPESESFIQIQIADSGLGIEPANLKTIFQRYKKFDSEQADYSGTGIGLDFCQKLISLHNGYIKAENAKERGAVFSFVLPVNQNNLATSLTEAVVENGGAVSVTSQTKEIIKRKHKTVLVVEDDAELNQLLTESLKEYYSVLSSFDGSEALELIENKAIDLIVSDVMMPSVNGFEFCEQVKTSEKWAHIPFILLSAKTDIETQISGLNTGADLYITKPFEMNYLLAVVDSQMSNREKIHQIFMNGAMPKFEKDELNQNDILFLKKVNKLIEENYRNTAFNVADLAQLMNMSRSTFYRKFIGLTNVTPNDYIKKFKVNKAVELLKTKSYSIAETSELAGFATQGYFSTTFKNEMGLTPSEFVKKNV
ncbi:two-component regulator propeller domain-containing protein [uncultured Draconibacterium sp.]|uniref:hybrid sensor histidine kinase/response regulator transcription factor n=1 Tax=uncultured Draconibacterium sp. TaxID=1573823 RepID=UPI0029C930B5|nr:two-component regulator propeller domain-containing protein [uncultured Draconibacterium sp.]